MRILYHICIDYTNVYTHFIFPYSVKALIIGELDVCSLVHGDGAHFVLYIFRSHCDRICESVSENQLSFRINGSDSSGKLVRVWFIVWHLWLSVITRLFCTHTVLWEETRGDNLSTWFVYWSVFLLDQLLLQLLLLSVRFLVNALHINLSKHVRSNYFCRLKVLSKYRD